MELQRICSCDTAHYRFMESLLVQAFPVEEYRPLEELRTLTEEESRFHNHVIVDAGIPVGLITYWDFGDFHYVEHFAVAPELRNGGMGARVLACVKERLSTPIVLEVEMPVEEMARRRVGFYGRQGFVLWENAYVQPPYRPGGDSLPMRLMVCGDLRSDRDFHRIEKTIHREVYQFMPL